MMIPMMIFKKPKNKKNKNTKKPKNQKTKKPKKKKKINTVHNLITFSIVFTEKNFFFFLGQKI